MYGKSEKLPLVVLSVVIGCLKNSFYFVKRIDDGGLLSANKFFTIGCLLGIVCFSWSSALWSYAAL